MDGIILAGGQSRRMGRDKALLRWQDSPLLHHVAHALQQVTTTVIIVADTPDRYAVPGCRTVGDLSPGEGPLGGLVTGLHYTGGEHAAAVGCDMPHLQPDLLRLLDAECRGYEAAVPVVDGRMQPICAVYARSAAPRLEALFRSGCRSVQEAVRALNVHLVDEERLRAADPELCSFRNVNTPAEYAALSEPRPPT